MPSRRDFLQQAAAAAGFASVARAQPQPSRSFIDIRRQPDDVVVQTGSADRVLRRVGQGSWEDGDLRVAIAPAESGMRVQLASPSTAVRRARLRWRGRLDDVRLILGDAWERGYGDLEWHGFVPDRVMPWYFATTDGRTTYACGVRTGANALCFWQVDLQGISLWLDVRSGGAPLELGARDLHVCDVLTRAGRTDESAFSALQAFCRQMCTTPRMPAQPVYGSNDWYWAYGKNSAATILSDAQRVVELAPTGTNRPFAVIDDGWQPERGQAKAGVGTWDRGNEKFPDIGGLAGEIRRAGARPGIWIRPLLAPANAPDSWRLPRDRAILDPTIPDVRQKITEDVARVRGWGYELIKHDYTTFDIFGRWGSTMADALTRDGWTFASGPKQTTAEVINELYRTIRGAAADAIVIGCNTMSHLSAGVFDICRVGDDTSGRDWARTRKMGVNSLAFRGPQHGAFYVADADCVGVTTAVPWRFNRQWLDLLARSGTMLFVSIAPDAIDADVRRDLRAAFERAARPQPLGEPIDWQQTTWPSRWKLAGEEVSFDWIDM